MSATVAFSRAHFPVSSLGYGRRVGIWLQGCTIRCAGCIVPETWDPLAEHSVVACDLIATLEPWLAVCDGVTISGGEPFDQPVALRELIATIRPRITGDVLVFSGYSEAYLRRRHGATFALADAAIVGPFRTGLADDRAFIGSRNQRVVINTALGALRYDDLTSYERRLDFTIRDTEILLAGVPQRGVISAFAAELRLAGIEAETTHRAV